MARQNYLPHAALGEQRNGQLNADATIDKQR
jgi:hypothetical protein